MKMNFSQFWSTRLE